MSEENAVGEAAPAPEIEHIPDEATVTRLIDAPRMYEPSKGLLWANTFEFPNGAGESVNWDKYARPPDEVHRLGKQRETTKREQKPEFGYAGYIPARVESIREIKTVRGHGFAVEHVPSEGIQHAEIHRKPNAQQPLQKGDKGELRLALEKAFGPLVPCPQPE